MDYKGKGYPSTNSEGWERNSNKFFKELDKKNSKLFSKQNKQRIYIEKQSPIIDDQFVESVPEYSKYKGEVLIHHHIGGGGQAAAYPESLHPGFGGIHNFEKEAGVTGNDYLSKVGEAFVQPKVKKGRK